jgi:hypothetical protein
MMRLALVNVARGISVRLFYAIWIRTSAVAFALWYAFSANNSWIPQAGLTLILILLLVSGVLLLLLAARDFFRDFRHFLKEHSQKDSHASV